jgi:hypothetical protein
VAINAIVPQYSEEQFYSQDVANLLSGSKLGFFTNAVAITATITLSGLTVCTAPGCGLQTLSGWAAPSIDGSGAAHGGPTTPVFTPSSSGGSGNIYGILIVDSTATFLICAANFSIYPTATVLPQGIPFSVPFDWSVLSRY